MTVVPAGILALAEAGLRLAGYGFPTRFFVEAPGYDAAMTNPRFGWRFFPPQVARAPLVQILPAAKAPGTYRIFVLGGSAAMGYPDPAYSFGRILRFMLSTTCPGVRFEVINAAMVAINSHVVREIAADCARFEPDLFVVLVGNNEVVGPFGPGTVFAGFSPSLAAIRASLWVRSLRIGQLLGEGIGGLSTRLGTVKVWRGMEMFLEKVVPAGDPRLAGVYEHFRANLAAICSSGRRAGAGVILCTVPTNVRDCAPFASKHGRDLPEAARARWQREYAAGIHHAEHAAWKAAIERFQAAAAMDGAFADLHFRLARCWWALGDPARARRHYLRARDLDALRFRADTRLNRIIREVARARKDGRVVLVDAVRAFETHPLTPHQTVGGELFFEHVHMNFAGSHALAAAVLARIVPLLPGPIRPGGSRPLSPPSCARCAEALALTDWDRLRMAESIRELTTRPPFVNQLDHARRTAERTRRRARLAQRLTPAGLDRAQRTYLRAIAERPDDLVLRDRFARLLAHCGDHAAAAAQLEVIVEKAPAHRKALDRLGLALAALHRFPEARACYDRALALDPTFVEAHNNLGLLMAAQGDHAAAVEHYRRAIAIKSSDASIWYNLGTSLRSLGRLDEAAGAFRRALALQPDDVRVHNNLANVLQMQGKLEEAVAHYRRALGRRPDYALAHQNLATALLALGRIDEAIEHLQAALRLRPEDADLRRRLGEARRRRRPRGPERE